MTASQATDLPFWVRRSGRAAMPGPNETGSGEERVVAWQVCVHLDQVGRPVTEEGEQDRATADAGHAVARRRRLMQGRDVALTIAEDVDEIGPELPVGQLCQLAVVAEDSVDSLVFTGDLARARNVLSNVVGQDLPQCGHVTAVEGGVATPDQRH